MASSEDSPAARAGTNHGTCQASTASDPSTTPAPAYFDNHARAYDKKPGVLETGTKVAAALRDAVAERLPNLKLSSADIMDFGCGTGNAALFLSPFVSHLVGVDASSGMLEVFREKAEQAGAKNIELEAVMLQDSNQLSGRRFDVIYSAFTMHHVEDVEGTILLLAQFLKPGGMLAIVDLLRTDWSYKFHNHHQHKTAGIHHHGGLESEQLQTFFKGAGLVSVDSKVVMEFAKLVEAEDSVLQFPVVGCFGIKSP